jgi:hypothetical protein
VGSKYRGCTLFNIPENVIIFCFLASITALPFVVKSINITGGVDTNFPDNLYHSQRFCLKLESNPGNHNVNKVIPKFLKYISKKWRLCNIKILLFFFKEKKRVVIEIKSKSNSFRDKK